MLLISDVIMQRQAFFDFVKSPSDDRCNDDFQNLVIIHG
jgi:hypothetical protein